MMIEAILVSTFTLVTAYRPVPEQTKPECRGRHECTTSINENVSMLGAAVSQDLLASGKIRYRDVLFIPGVGYRIVNDCTHHRLRNTVDVFVYTLAQERAMKPKRSAVWVIPTTHPEIKKGATHVQKLPNQTKHTATNGAQTGAAGRVHPQQKNGKIAAENRAGRAPRGHR